jgi:hypothetical protein
MVWELAICEILRIDLDLWIEVCFGTLDVEGTWRAIGILLTGKSKIGGALSYEIAKGRSWTIEQA